MSVSTKSKVHMYQWITMISTMLETHKIVDITKTTKVTPCKINDFIVFQNLHINQSQI